MAGTSVPSSVRTRRTSPGRRRYLDYATDVFDRATALALAAGLVDILWAAVDAVAHPERTGS